MFLYGAVRFGHGLTLSTSPGWESSAGEKPERMLMQVRGRCGARKFKPKVAFCLYSSSHLSFPPQRFASYTILLWIYFHMLTALVLRPDGATQLFTVYGYPPPPPAPVSPAASPRRGPAPVLGAMFDAEDSATPRFLGCEGV